MQIDDITTCAGLHFCFFSACPLVQGCAFLKNID